MLWKSLKKNIKLQTVLVFELMPKKSLAVREVKKETFKVLKTKMIDRVNRQKAANLEEDPASSFRSRSKRPDD